MGLDLRLSYEFFELYAHRGALYFRGEVPALVALTALDARSGFKDDCRASTFVAIFKRVLKKKHRSQRVWDFSSVLL